MKINNTEWKRICNHFNKNTCIGIFDFQSYRCVWMNTIFRQFLGKTLKEVQEKHWNDFLPNLSLFENKLIILFEEKLRKNINCDVNGTSYRLLKSSDFHFTVSFEDKGIYADYEFLSKISHELRTPLTGIIGVTSLLQETDLSSEQKDYMETLKQSSHNLISIVNDILDVSKLHMHKIQLENKPFYLRSCIESSFDIIAPEANKKHLNCSFEIKDNVPLFITSDKQRLLQIIVNLLNNSVRYSKKGSIHLSVSLANIDPATKQIELVFSVKDTGIGIPKKLWSKLFKPFTQLDQGTSKEYDGTGLGLVISKQLVELFDGEFFLESQVGVGSTFSFTIKTHSALIADSEDLTTKNAKEDIIQKLKDLKILVLDDKEENRHYLQNRLFKWDMTPYLFSSVEEALSFLKYTKNVHIDIALVDICMPKKSGVDFAKAIKKLPPTMQFPMIALSSFGDKIPEEWSFVDHIIKPFHEDRLLSTLHEHVFSFPVTTTTKPETKIPSILIVEDKYLNQKTLSCMLKHLKCTDINIANNGLEALELTSSKHYDIILMDLKMPHMGGITAASKLSKTKTHQTKVIALTALTIDPGEKEHILNEKYFDGYLDKPVDVQTLKKSLQQFGFF